MTSQPDAKARLYLQKKKVPELFESLLTGLLFNQPDNHISYIEECLASYKQSSESLQWNTFVAMPSAQNSKVFGVDSADNKPPSNTTPLPPIVDSQVSEDAESTEKSPSVPAKLDNKSVLPPISGETSSDATGDDDKQPAATVSASTSHTTEPLPPIVSDDKLVVFSGTEQTEVKKEDTSPLPPIEAKETKIDNVNTTELTESVKEEKSPLPPIAEKDTKADDAAAPSNTAEVTEIKKAETFPLPPIAADKKFGDVYFVLGGPGSGKGTQCAKIVEKFGLVHLSTGDLLRAEVKKESEQGQAIASIMKEGGLVSSETIVSLLKSTMSDTTQANGFLIDGFPRELDQAKIFEDTVCQCSRVLVFQCSDDTMTARLKQRGLSSGREDDNEETIRKRLETFHQQTIPVISHYQQKDKVWEVSAESTVEEVFGKVEQLFNSTVQSCNSQEDISNTNQQNSTES